MPGHCLAVAAKPAEQPISRALRVGHGLQRREGLRRNDEHCFRRVEVTSRLHEIGSIDVRDEAEGQAAITVMSERLVGHHGTEVGTADSDIDDVLDAFAGVPLPCAAPDAV